MIFNVLRIKTTCFEAHIITLQMLCCDVLSTNIFFAITFLNFIKILKLIRLLPHPVMYKLLIQVDVVHMSIVQVVPCSCLPERCINSVLAVMANFLLFE